MNMYYDMKSGRLLAIGEEAEVKKLASENFTLWIGQLVAAARLKGINPEEMIYEANDVDAPRLV